jgi:F-box/TPR repeat protein Pof3
VTLNGLQIIPGHVDCTTWTELQYLDLSNTQLSRLPRLPSTLRYLNLSNNTLLHVGVDEEMPNELPLLETFNCESTNISSDVLRVLTMASITNGKLKTLMVGGRLCEHRPRPAADEYPASEILEELSLSAMQLNDAGVLPIIELYPRLRKLDVSGTRVTGVAVRQFVEGGITSLNLDNCADVGSDAVEWARGKGVEVSFIFRQWGKAKSSFWYSSFAQGFA